MFTRFITHFQGIRLDSYVIIILYMDFIDYVDKVMHPGVTPGVRETLLGSLSSHPGVTPGVRETYFLEV